MDRVRAATTPARAAPPAYERHGRRHRQRRRRQRRDDRAGGATIAGAGGSATDGGASGTGLLKNGMCYPVCGFPAITNPTGDGYGWEQQRTCLVATSPAAANTTPCNPTPLPDLPAPGNGVSDGKTCMSYCSSAQTDTTHTGYGYEHGRNCIVAGTAAAYGGVPCAPPPLPPARG